MLAHTEDSLRPLQHVGWSYLWQKLTTFFKKLHLRNLLQNKMNIALDKYTRTNTVKVLHEYFVTFKVKHFM